MKRFLQMTRIVFVVAFLTGLVGGGISPDERERLLRHVSDSVTSNPVPVAFAVATFLVTLRYRNGRSKVNRKPVEVAGAGDTAVLRRAQARATRTQLVADQILLENRKRALPDAIRQAERDASYTENAFAEAERALVTKEQAHDDAVARLTQLRREQAGAQAEVAAIQAELRKLADVV